MELIQYPLDFILHIDVHLVELLQEYKTWIYLILFLIVFCETGLIVTPFLPGDSLLFALGTLASSNLNLLLLILLLYVAAILGDSFNYFTGFKLGDKVYLRNYWFLSREHLDKTQRFYKRYAGRTIIYAPFIPIVRTFAPFVAGVGKMHYRKFFYYNVVGALAWVLFFTLVGYTFGNMPAVKKNFSMLILGIIAISLVPPVWGVLKQKLASKN